MENSKKRRFWEKALQDQERCGLTQARFCRERNLSYATFKYWKKKIEQDPFIELPVVQDEAQVEKQSPLVSLSLPGGASLTITW